MGGGVCVRVFCAFWWSVAAWVPQGVVSGLRYVFLGPPSHALGCVDIQQVQAVAERLAYRHDQPEPGLAHRKFINQHGNGIIVSVKFLSQFAQVDGQVMRFALPGRTQDRVRVA